MMNCQTKVMVAVHQSNMMTIAVPHSPLMSICLFMHMNTWMKTGPDSPENFLAYYEFDATINRGNRGSHAH